LLWGTYRGDAGDGARATYRSSLSNACDPRSAAKDLFSLWFSGMESAMGDPAGPPGLYPFPGGDRDQ